MTLPNDSILVTPGSGATVATHAVSSKEYQVVVLADAAGQLIDDPVGVFATAGLAMAKAASRNYLTLFNGDASLVVDVLGVYVSQEATAAVTGLVRGYRLFRTTSTAPTGGTLQTPAKLDTTTGALDADIAARVSSGSGVTATASGDALAAVGVGEEETGSGGGRHWLWNWKIEGAPIVLRQNEGVVVQQDATTGTGLVSAGVIFRVRA